MRIRPEICSVFDILALLGTGSTTKVYKARSRSTQSLVALKVLDPDVPRPNIGFRRLDREGQIMSACVSPGILRAYDMDAFDDQIYLAMELAEGGSLADHLTGPWMVRDAVRVVEAIAHAVAHVHSQGVVHRGIHARHIFLCQEEVPKLGGFGAAVPATTEQVYAEGIAEDLHALGTLLFDLLTGGYAREASRSDAPIAPPSDLPNEVKNIYLKAVAKHPARRYASAAEMAGDLNRFGM